jgi:hypothetical protein
VRVGRGVDTVENQRVEVKLLFSADPKRCTWHTAPVRPPSIPSSRAIFRE